MKVERFDIAAVDDCLDTLEAAFQSDMWRELPEQDRRRLVNRLYIILREIGEGSKVTSRSKARMEDGKIASLRNKEDVA
jgi:hypothetical protein